MTASFKTNPLNDFKFPLLKVCIENYQEMIKLRNLYPVIEFVNYMVNSYSHMITRIEARKLTLAEAIKQTNEDGMIKFNKFRKAWSKIGFEAKIQYKCHKNTYIKEYND